MRDALGDQNLSPDAVWTVVRRRFGEKAVTYDPSDPEANKLAVTQGYIVVHGGQMTSDEWANVRAAGALLPAGKVTPSPKPFTPGGKPLQIIDRSDLTADQAAIVALYERLGQVLVDTAIRVEVVDAPGVGWGACYGKDNPLYLNGPELGQSFFAQGVSERVLDLLIHELGHHYCGDHLSEEYFKALTMLGARLALAVARDPGLLHVEKEAPDRANHLLPAGA